MGELIFTVVSVAVGDQAVGMVPEMGTKTIVVAVDGLLGPTTMGE